MDENQNKETEQQPIIKDENHIKALEKHIDDSEKQRENAMQRFDGMILAIATLGIGFVATYMKDFIKDNPKADTTELLWTQGAFLTSVVANLFSQVSSLFSGRNSSKRSRLILFKYRHDVPYTGYSDRQHDRAVKWRGCRVIFFDVITKILNILAFITLLTGIVLFLHFTGLFRG